MQRKRVVALVATFALSLLSVVGGVALVTKEGPKQIGEDYWTKRLLACQDKSIIDTGILLEKSYDCLRDTIWHAVETDSFPQFAAAADPIMAEDIRLEYVCHIPGHDLGADIIEHYNYDWATAIKAMSFDLCGGGFVHGIYDVFGKEYHTKNEWVAIGDYCWDAIQIRYSACGDAIGHSAYESSGEDLEAAMRICDWQRQEAIQTPCANGAYMQANFPQSSKLKDERGAKLTPSSDWEKFVTFCDDIDFQSYGAEAGCYFGAGWVMGNNIYMELQNMRTETFDEFKSTPEMDAKVMELIGAATDACKTMENTIEGILDGCVYIMLARMPLFFYMDVDRFEEFCRASVTGLRDVMYLECLASGHEHITPETMRALMNKYEGLESIMVRRGLALPPQFSASTSN